MPVSLWGVMATFGSYRQLKTMCAAIVLLTIPLLSQGGEPEMTKAVSSNNLLDFLLIKENPVKSDKATGLLKVQLIFKGGEAVVDLYDNPSSRDLASLLPLTLMFSDYNNVEKVAYPPRKIITENAPFGLTPTTGDFALYAPWGNLVVYYRGYRHSNDLIPLGHFVSGLQQLAAINGKFSVRIEKFED